MDNYIRLRKQIEQYNDKVENDSSKCVRLLDKYEPFYLIDYKKLNRNKYTKYILTLVHRIVYLELVLEATEQYKEDFVREYFYLIGTFGANIKSYYDEQTRKLYETELDRKNKELVYFMQGLQYNTFLDEKIRDESPMEYYGDDAEFLIDTPGPLTPALGLIKRPSRLEFNNQDSYKEYYSIYHSFNQLLDLPVGFKKGKVMTMREASLTTLPKGVRLQKKGIKYFSPTNMASYIKNSMRIQMTRYAHAINLHDEEQDYCNNTRFVIQSVYAATITEKIFR